MRLITIPRDWRSNLHRLLDRPELSGGTNGYSNHYGNRFRAIDRRELPSLSLYSTE